LSSFFSSSFLQLLKHEFGKLRNLEFQYQQKRISEDVLIENINSSMLNIWQNVEYVVRGIGKPTYQNKITDVFVDNGEKVVIKGRKRYQSWSLNPTYGFYYAIGGGGNGFVIVLDKTVLPSDGFRLMQYGRLRKELMESGEYGFTVPWNFWREMEVRTKSSFSVPKSSLIVFTQNKRIKEKLNKMGIQTELVKNLWTEREKLRKISCVELR